MSTQPANIVTPPASAPVVHPPIPFNLGSYIALTGPSGAVAAFLVAWGENHWHMTGPIAALAVAAAVGVAAWYQGRSHQAAALIARIGRELASAGIDVSTTPKP